jgi:hypothetical protein
LATPKLEGKNGSKENNRKEKERKNSRETAIHLFL